MRWTGLRGDCSNGSSRQLGSSTVIPDSSGTRVGGQSARERSSRSNGSWAILQRVPGAYWQLPPALAANLQQRHPVRQPRRPRCRRPARRQVPPTQPPPPRRWRRQQPCPRPSIPNRTHARIQPPSWGSGPRVPDLGRNAVAGPGLLGKVLVDWRSVEGPDRRGGGWGHGDLLGVDLRGKSTRSHSLVAPSLAADAVLQAATLSDRTFGQRLSPEAGRWHLQALRLVDHR